MSAIIRAGARLRSVGELNRAPAFTKTTHHRRISWMAFELPDPALYQSSPSLQPKRPAGIEAVPSTSPSTQPAVSMAGKVGAPASAASSRVPEASSAYGKIVPTSVPASAMRSGPMPLSQIQKRTFTGSDFAGRGPSTPAQQQQQQQSAGSPQQHDNKKEAPIEPYFPTLQIRMPGSPATWPVQQPEFPGRLRGDDE